MIPSPAHLDIRDDRFRRLVHPTAQLRRLCTGLTWTEGPVWFGDRDCLIFSEIPSQMLYQWSERSGLSIFRERTAFNNGNTRDRQGRLVGCRHGTRDVVRTEHDGRLTVLASTHEGRRLNSPNDVAVSRDGTIWFTDPTYGIISNFEGHRAQPEQPARNVYRLPPEGGSPRAMITDFAQPNGLCFSPDERLLYVAESGSSHDPAVPPVIRRYQVEGEAVTFVDDFAVLDNGLPDGMRCDAEGNLWTSAGDGVHCFAPDGGLMGKILIPETVSNLCFGGHNLFITATTSVYVLFVDVQGAEEWTRCGGF
ncbi:SMP-30/gluconolactonase/LRE family protein [Paracoccus tibetensis]|uniref:Gluconolactonase n=1 Tax=Paracoccus tibetensis TaxID=336292 RepID=A0A1G5K2A5_9RHOB|nr:SMP-30/gluconolactonase/LRE family protein [Paracoccus tibetensis]SCY94009.1 gluconolactonase [Paracoccus tibetensis]